MTTPNAYMRTAIERAQAGADDANAPPAVRTAYRALVRSYEIEAANTATRREARALVTAWEKDERERQKRAEEEREALARSLL